MLPYTTMISIDKTSRVPLYLQVTNGIIQQIIKGRMSPGLKLPGTRTMAEYLNVHRNTIISCYQELEAQGWITAKRSQGNFVSDQIPQISKKKKSNTSESLKRTSAYFNFKQDKPSPNLGLLKTGNYELNLDDGCPDVRIAPIHSIGNYYKNILNSVSKKRFDYSWQLSGHVKLKEALRTYLSETRGINVMDENILITRGSLMGFHLFFKNLLDPKDNVIVGRLSYEPVNQIIRDFGGNLVQVEVDNDGINVDEIEQICQHKKIKAVYVIPHHHHPTTVSLSCPRRMKLLMLAEEYKFAIVEDDYDFDFHYKHSPILPLMSSDELGSVVYAGSFSKTLAPAFRIGYLIAPKNVIQHLEYSRRYIDRQGDLLLEQALGMMIQEGELKRHIRKALLIYKNRRDHFCQLLKEELGCIVRFKKPDGGLAVWTHFDKAIDLNLLVEKVRHKGLFMVSPSIYYPTQKQPSSTRIGFASMNEEELSKSVAILKKIVLNV